MEQKKEIWIDNVKVIACVLVVLGHFFQSMVLAEILEVNAIYLLFNQSIYAFHVPLFFICSGYLYQKYSRVDSISSWKKNILKKLLSLGIPYFVFSIVQWSLKSIFSGVVNTGTGGLFQTLFIEPMSPYWYLYCLFLIFMFTPTFNCRRLAKYVLVTAFALKMINITTEFRLFAVSTFFSNEIWFVIGMCLCVSDIVSFMKTKKAMIIGIAAAIIFLLGSIAGFQNDTLFWDEKKTFPLGLIACWAVILLVGYFCKENRQKNIFAFLAKYTMPIFLMHTIFAAAMRIVLLRFGINSSVIHVLIGIAISFIGPVIASDIMKKLKLDILLYPGRYIVIK